MEENINMDLFPFEIKTNYTKKLWADTLLRKNMLHPYVRFPLIALGIIVGIFGLLILISSNLTVLSKLMYISGLFGYFAILYMGIKICIFQSAKKSRMIGQCWYYHLKENELYGYTKSPEYEAEIYISYTFFPSAAETKDSIVLFGEQLNVIVLDKGELSQKDLHVLRIFLAGRIRNCRFSSGSKGSFNDYKMLITICIALVVLFVIRKLVP